MVWSQFIRAACKFAYARTTLQYHLPAQKIFHWYYIQKMNHILSYTHDLMKLQTMVCNHTDVSENSGTPKSSIFNRVFHSKPSILGYPYFWKHPYLIDLVSNLIGRPHLILSSGFSICGEGTLSLISNMYTNKMMDTQITSTVSLQKIPSPPNCYTPED